VRIGQWLWQAQGDSGFFSGKWLIVKEPRTPDHEVLS